MAAGINYGEQVIVDAYPCDIESIVRYRGGFNWHSQALTEFADVELPPLSPMWVNLTDRTVFPCVRALDAAPSEVDVEKNLIKHALLYNRVKVEKGVTVTLILRANEVSFSGLNALYYLEGSDKTQIVPYVDILTYSLEREELMKALDTCTFVW